ncbi:unnamed protein product [Pleuronectes platessa]|uniref:Uncharacterized protein n=1 Tax=Pleuronectes platessa TaxID=8262 RepID=A0A9N7U1A9_PLEPL|nr:unnamed protein product [Pleuronectes platessa]
MEGIPDCHHFSREKYLQGCIQFYGANRPSMLSQIESEGMQRGTGDQIIPLSQRAAWQRSCISKHLSDGGLDSGTQLGDEEGEIKDEGITNNLVSEDTLQKSQ